MYALNTMTADRKAAHDGSRAARRSLTPRQREVLALICEGLSNKHICSRLNISCSTVKAHIGAILRAIGVSNRLQAAIWAERCGLL